MNASKIGYAVLIIIVFSLIAWALSLIGRTQQPVVPETHLLSGIATTSGLEYKEDHPYYAIDLIYPETGNQAEQTVIEQALQKEIEQYKESVADAGPSLEPALASGYKLALSANFKKYSGAGNTTSYLFTIYEDTGGAHPNHYFDSFVFDASGAQVSLAQVFVSTSTNAHADYLNQIAGQASVAVEDELRTRLGGDPSDAIFSDGLAPTSDNYGIWVIDGQSLRFFFPPYQVAAYAAGDFEVPMALSSFGDSVAPAYRR